MANSKGTHDVPPPSPYSDLPEVVSDDILPSYDTVVSNDLLQQTTAVRGILILNSQVLWPAQLTLEQRMAASMST